MNTTPPRLKAQIQPAVRNREIRLRRNQDRRTRQLPQNLDQKTKDTPRGPRSGYQRPRPHEPQKLRIGINMLTHASAELAFSFFPNTSKPGTCTNYSTRLLCGSSSGPKTHKERQALFWLADSHQVENAGRCKQLTRNRRPLACLPFTVE